MRSSDALKPIYEAALPRIRALSRRFAGVSSPLFLSPPEAFDSSKFRVLIIGQQTNGWGDGSESATGLQQLYERYDLGRNSSGTPFWAAAHRMYGRLAKENPPRAFAWSNLVKVDQHERKSGGDRPEPDLEQSITALGLLQHEIDILRPDVVIFFTGPYYRELLKESFRGCNFTPLTNLVQKVSHPSLPALSYETYHPKFLQLSRQLSALDVIVDDVR